MTERQERSKIPRVPFDPSKPSAGERLFAVIFNVPWRTPEERLRSHQLALEQTRVFLSQELGRPIEEIPADEEGLEGLHKEYLDDQAHKSVESFFEGLSPQERSVL